MLIYIQILTIEQISGIISIATPIILFLWFYYSQRQTLSKNYFEQIDGIYAGFTEPLSYSSNGKRIYGGIIMNIRDTDDKGYFKGDFDFAESYTDFDGNRIMGTKVRDGIHTFLGKIDFTIYRDKSRHPFRPDENRIYKGTLYIVDRLDFAFDNYKIETYLTAEYDIIHYREMQTLKFTFRKKYRPETPEFPQTFILYKKMGASFEPYRNVRETVFFGDTRSDK